MKSVTLAHLITAWVLTFSGELCMGNGKAGVPSSKEDVLQSSQIPSRNDSNQKTPVLKLVVPPSHVLNKTHTSNIGELVFSRTISRKMTPTTPSTTVASTSQSFNLSANTGQSYLPFNDITADFSSHSLNSGIDWPITSILYEVSTPYPMSSEFDEATGVLILQTWPTEANTFSSSFIFELPSSSIVESHSTERGIFSTHHENIVAHSSVIQITSAIKIHYSSSSKLVPDSTTSTSEPETRPKTHTVPRKPPYVGSAEENNNIHLLGGMTPGAKVTIGIVITLCILGLVIAGVVTYRRYTHRSLKSFLTSGVQYKTYDNSTYKDDEGMLILPDRR